MNSKRIVFLLLAVIVAGTTAFLARAWLQSERAAIAAQMGGQRPIAKPATQVLVARAAIHTGQLIKPDDLRWQPWPQGNLPASYIVEGKRPIGDFVGAVARSQFHVGEPIVESDIVMPGSRGFLAAVLKPGLRAVSVPASATSTVSGFIYAGDRVDVLLTHVLVAVDGKGEQHTATETILRNARVIAMDQKLDFTPGDKPDVAKTATLELTAKQTEIVTLAVKMGELSLVLRSLQDPADEERDAASGDDATAELGDSYTHDSQVSRLIKDPNPPPKPSDAMKTSVFVLHGNRATKQDLDGSVVSDPSAAPPAEPEGPKPTAPRTTTVNRPQESVPQ
ncbi:MAG: Flp pilus assembly protein CpaB [Reyranella sp.]